MVVWDSFANTDPILIKPLNNYNEFNLLSNFNTSLSSIKKKKIKTRPLIREYLIKQMTLSNLNYNKNDVN